MIYLKAFIAGFASTLVFHQGVLWLLYAGGFSPRAPWNMTPVPPLNVPAAISLAFWGGLWGIVLWALIGASHGGAYWTKALVIGALGPSLVAWFVVMPIKGFGPRWRLGPENHCRRSVAERRLGTRRRAANAATEPGQSSIPTLIRTLCLSQKRE
jgi:hypothetical protein